MFHLEFFSNSLFKFIINITQCRRYQVLDEGAKGLDHWIETLHKDKGMLEKSKHEQEELILSLEKNIKSYHTLCEQKDYKWELHSEHT